jgi:Tyrosine phosphatase family
MELSVRRTLVLLLLPLLLLAGNPPDAKHPAPGTSLVRFAQLDDGVYKGSKPRNDADFQFLESKHIKYILELNFLPFLSKPEKGKAKKYGMTLLSVHMNASPLAPSEKHVARIMSILRDKRFHPIYLHCDIGRDRTSLIAGLYEIYYHGMSPQDAWQKMKGYGFKDSWTLRGLKTYFYKHPKPPTLIKLNIAPRGNVIT